MEPRGSGLLAGAGILLAVSCTAVSGIDGYLFDLAGGGAGGEGGLAGSVTTGGGGGAAGSVSNGGAAAAAGNGGGGGCQPGTTQEGGACGDCGTELSTCTNEGIWGPPSCENEGPCSEGTTQPANCDSCSQQTCGTDCHWSDCELKPGNECDYGDGETWEYCDGGTTHWRFCLYNCLWASCQPIP